jgi:hypothetical protein
MSQEREHKAMEQAFHLKREIDRVTDDLVREAKKLVDEKLTVTKAGQIRLDAGGLREAQLRNVINVADGTGSVELVKNFVRYQIGRQGGGWRHRGFGEALVERIDKEVAGLAQRVAHEAQAEVGQTHIQLVRLFLGYLNRYFVYLDKTA